MRNPIYLFSYLWLGLTRKILHQLTDWACKSHITFGRECHFRKTAKVENISRDPKKIVLGDNVTIEGKLLIFNYGGQIEIGDNVYIGEGSNIRSGEHIRIGDNVLISHNVNIIDSNTHELNYLERADGYLNLLKYGHPKDKGSIVTGKIIIEDYVWISFGVTILKNVTIGKGAVIAANSVVTKNVDPFVLVSGNPARVVKKLEENE